MTQSQNKIHLNEFGWQNLFENKFQKGSTFVFVHYECKLSYRILVLTNDESVMSS